MKSFTKIIFTLLATVFFALSGQAQNTNLLRVQWEGTFMQGNNNNSVQGFTPRGIGVEFNSFVSNNVSVGGRISWNTFYKNIGWKTIVIDQPEDAITVEGYQKKYVNIVPFMFTLHYAFNNRNTDPFAPQILPFVNKKRSIFVPYVGLDFGFVWIQLWNVIGDYSFEEKGLHFGVSPVVGTEISFGEKSSWGVNVNFRYNWAAKSANAAQQTWINANIGISHFW